MEQFYIRHVEVLGFEKRFFPSQHYVYMLLVKWSDQSEKLIYRRYPEMHEFHKALKEMFPIEAGDIDAKDRIIPSLPAPKWLDNLKATETRQGTLAEYCTALINLPRKMSQCQLVRDFFEVRPEDETPPAPHPFKRNETYVLSKGRQRSNTSEITGPIMLDSYRVTADFNKSSKYELNLKAGDLVDIVEKCPNGWWFCNCEATRGWVPASYLEPLDGPDESEEQAPNYAGELYITTKAYKGAEEDELTLESGEIIDVIHKLLDGWWVVRKGRETGYYPSMFLHKIEGEKETEAEKSVVQRKTPPPRRSTIRNINSIHTNGRQKISQDTYRKNSRRYIKPRGNNSPQLRTRRSSTKSLLLEREAHRDNIPTLRPSGDDEQKKTPVIPPRPSAQLIMERCTENTRKKMSIRTPS
ncbi:neutrophil cytosol factor 1 [Clupea harengus]|uniref:Neutrophil cytosol factor 1 n=1 Tax=Clupea harengus TaxID=7950 RepID=A0A6P3VQE9_CLUHA|nr:neutrophil cytosol factor 1 [Clupea harengus]